MGKKKYCVHLTPEERTSFEQIVETTNAARWKIKRAQAMLKCDESPDGPSWPDSLIAEAYDITVQSVENWRKQAFLKGPLSLLTRKPRPQPARKPKFDGETEARLVALTCSEPPMGHGDWSLRLLAERAVALDIVDTVSHETIRQTLKKTS